MFKLAASYALLRKMCEKQAGIGVPLALGAGAVAGIHTLGKGIHKAKEYKAGFQPGGVTNE